MIYKIALLFFLSICATSCSKYYVSVSRKKVDARDLASTHVGTPDPRQAHPPCGQMLIIDWRLPQHIVKAHPYIALDLIYWNNTEKSVFFPIRTPIGYATYSLLDERFDETGGILTYRAQVVGDDGRVYKEWRHQLWVNLIQINDPVEDKQESAQDTNASVEDQSMQPSVTETVEEISPESD
jgi:hypothetical protein